MNVKRYVAQDMQEAMAKIRSELGSDAIILNSRKVRKKGIAGVFAKPMLEVNVAFERQAARPSRTSSEPGGSGAALRPSAKNSDKEKDEQLSVMDKRIVEMQESLEKITLRMENNRVAGSVKYSEKVEALLYKLLDNDVQDELAHELAQKTDNISAKVGTESREVMEQLITQQLGEVSLIKPKRYQRNVIMLVGATGVGKTTTLVKLAADFAYNYGQKVVIINNDTYRVAAQEQLGAYAEILGTPLCVTYSPDEIVGVIQKHEDADMFFIDTSGRSPGDKKHHAEIQKIIEEARVDEVLLFLSASTGVRACREIIAQYEYLKDYKLVITKLDETKSRGMILNACAFSGKPLSYMTIGQNIPDDITVADVNDISRRILE